MREPSVSSAQALDLEPIKKRYAGNGDLANIANDVPDLIAEIERLRAPSRATPEEEPQ